MKSYEIGLEIEIQSNFKPVEFDGFRKEAGLNSFTLSTQKWVESTNAIGLVAKSGRYGGTYAHKDIAFEFASWISPKFKLYLIKEFQRLKNDEIEKQKIGWNKLMLNSEFLIMNKKVA